MTALKDATGPSVVARLLPRQVARVGAGNLGEQQTHMAVAAIAHPAATPLSWPMSSAGEARPTSEACPYCGEPGYRVTFEDIVPGVLMRGACEQCGTRTQRFLPGWRSPAP
jgi:hypothetical protein